MLVHTELLLGQTKNPEVQTKRSAKELLPSPAAATASAERRRSIGIVVSRPGDSSAFTAL